MAKHDQGVAHRHMQTLFQVGTLGGLTDGELLERYQSHSGEAAELAFAALVERHGPMVLRVCRAILGDEHDAHDAFQATFLVLVRRAGGLWTRDSLGPWLHQVAYRVACCARSAGFRRRRHERRLAERASNVTPAGDQNVDDLSPVLHEELGRLPERDRAVMVLCWLEGLTQQQAARHLGWPLGTVQSRLARGRQRLAARLTRRGVAPSAGVLAATLATAPAPARAAVPPALAEATIRAATAPGAVPAAVAELVKGVQTTMFLIRQKRLVAILLALGAAGATVAGVRARPSAEDATAAASATAPHEQKLTLMPSYVIEPPDLILVEVLEALPGRPISGERLVRPDGTISLGFYGDVSVAGLTIPQVKEKILLHLRGQIPDESLGLTQTDEEGNSTPIEPAKSNMVFVDVSAYNSKSYYVQGDVAAPGKFPVTGKETVLDAINYAGGLIPLSAPQEMCLVRPPRPGAEHPQVLKVDYDAIVHKGDPRTNYQILPGDRLVVPRDPKAEARVANRGPAPDIAALESRLEHVEHKLDRLIELVGGAKPPPPTSEREDKKPRPPHEGQ
jgi:RNA polymerase sigma factor (sigma-70 family)